MLTATNHADTCALPEFGAQQIPHQSLCLTEAETCTAESLRCALCPLMLTLAVLMHTALSLVTLVQAALQNFSLWEKA